MISKPQSIKGFLFQEIARQRQSLFLWSPVCLGVGIVFYFTVSFIIPWPTLLVAIFILLLMIAKSVHGYSHTGHAKWLSILLISIALILSVSGFSIAKLRTSMVNTPMLLEDMPITVINGTIEKLVKLEGKNAKRIILKNVPIQGKEYRVRLKTYHFKGNDWQIGDIISVKAKLLAPSGPVMPGGFDYSRKAYYDRIGAVGYTLADAALIEKSQKGNNGSIIARTRSKIGSIVYSAMDEDTAGIAQALLTGERAGIAKNDEESLRVAGLAHLLAISGLHIGLVAGCVFFFLRLILACIPNMALNYPIKKWAALAAMTVAFGYMILAGATVPTVRAFIMTSLVLLAVILDRSALNMRLVALAALFVMITTPEAVMGPSFVLSFAAVAALIVFYRDLGRRWLVTANAYKPLWRPFYYIFGIIVTSLVATAATAPFSVMYFNRFAVYSVVSNVIAMPLMAFIVMPAGLISIILIPTGMDGHFWFIMAWGIDQILSVAYTVSNYDYAFLSLPAYDTAETFLITFGFIILLLWHGYLRVIGFIFMVAGLLLSLSTPPKAVLIADRMQAILYVDKSEDKIFLIGRMNSYLKSNWLGFYGYDLAVDIPVLEKGDNINSDGINCDDYGCYIDVGQTKVSILQNGLGIYNACTYSDVIIADFPIKDYACPAARIIDRFDVWRQGATTITFKNNGYRIETVAGD